MTFARHKASDHVNGTMDSHKGRDRHTSPDHDPVDTILYIIIRLHEKQRPIMMFFQSDGFISTAIVRLEGSFQRRQDGILSLDNILRFGGLMREPQQNILGFFSFEKGNDGSIVNIFNLKGGQVIVVFFRLLLLLLLGVILVQEFFQGQGGLCCFGVVVGHEPHEGRHILGLFGRSLFCAFLVGGATCSGRLLGGLSRETAGANDERPGTACNIERHGCVCSASCCL